MPKSSAAAMAVLPHLQPVKVPPAPASLTPKQAELWKTFITSKPSDWFDPGSLPLVAALCKHTTSFDDIDALMQGLDLSDDEQLKRYSQLELLRDRESKAMANLSAKLRLTIQSRYTPMSARTAAMRGSRYTPPWEYESENVFAKHGKRNNGGLS
jgi:hypothetical protein